MLPKTFQLFTEGDQCTCAQETFHMNFNVALVLGGVFSGDLQLLPRVMRSNFNNT